MSEKRGRAGEIAALRAALRTGPVLDRIAGLGPRPVVLGALADVLDRQKTPQAARLVAAWLTLDVTDLAPGERRVVDAFLGGRAFRPVTYDQAAAAAGVHVGTVKRVLTSVCRERPSLHLAIRAVRVWQLRRRHREAVERRRVSRARRAFAGAAGPE